MTNRRVFVIWTHPLFHESIRLLLNHPGIEWVGATPDHRVAREEIIRLQPDTILIEEGESGGTPGEAMGILETGPSDVRVIRLSLADNALSVYHREQRVVGQAEDLLRLIQNDH